MQALETRVAKGTAFEQLHGAVIIPMRLCHAAREQQGLVNAGFALIHGDPIAQRGLIFDDPCGEMRHDGKTFT